MSQNKTLHIYLNKSVLENARKGKVGIVNKIVETMQGRGFVTKLQIDTEAERLKSVNNQGYSLFRMKDPFHDRAMTFRQVYLPSFWQIETTAKRWEWKTAKAKFKPEIIDKKNADWFVNYWRGIIFGELQMATHSDYVFVPLQGRLLLQRSFQTATPIEMIKATLRYSEGRKVIASLHPQEDYSARELAALEAIADNNNRFSWVKGGSDELLQGCEYVVTQNSGMAFKGYFLHKPVLLFGYIDFHHIAIKAWESGQEQAFRQITKTKPDYNQYLFWFLRHMSIHAGRDDAADKIVSAFQSGGWDV